MVTVCLAYVVIVVVVHCRTGLSILLESFSVAAGCCRRNGRAMEVLLLPDDKREQHVDNHNGGSKGGVEEGGEIGLEKRFRGGGLHAAAACILLPCAPKGRTKEFS